MRLGWVAARRRRARQAPRAAVRRRQHQRRAADRPAAAGAGRAHPAFPPARRAGPGDGGRADRRLNRQPPSQAARICRTAISASAELRLYAHLGLPIIRPLQPCTTHAHPAPDRHLLDGHPPAAGRAGRRLAGAAAVPRSRFESVGGVDAAKRVQAGEAFDVVVLAADAIDKLIAAGHVRRRQPGRPGALGVAVAVRAGAPRPDIGTRRRAARRPCWPRAASAIPPGPAAWRCCSCSSAGASPTTLRERIVQAPPGVPVGALVARGEVELGFQQLQRADAPAGHRACSATMPAGAQIVTTFSAGAVHGARRSPTRCAQLLAFMQLAGRRRQPSGATAWSRPERRLDLSRRPAMIIDCHGHYTTAPKALEDWRNRQIAGIKDPALDAEGRRAEDQRRRAARVDRDQPAAPDEGARQRPDHLQPARQLHGAPHRRLRGQSAPGRRSATSCATASASSSPTTSSRRRCCRRARASTRPPAFPSW